MAWKIIFSPQALKDSKKIAISPLREKVKSLLDIVQQNPYQNPPSYEKLKGNKNIILSRRINVQHRLTYEVNKEEGIIKIARMWTHYK